MRTINIYMRYLSFILFALLFCRPGFAQSQGNTSLQRPKLVVGIVVDQMRWDYLYKFYDLYDKNGGFKKFLNQGFSCENTLIPYTPTVTAAGHTCVYTGSVPAINGIVGNGWYDRTKGRSVYCSDDDTARTIGASDENGKMSPRNLVVTTVTDELRLATNFASKVVGISIKDRGAIFPAGHVANAAYWFDPKVGSFISSSYYMNELPGWVNNFNGRKLPDSLYNLNWNLSKPASVYTKYCVADEQAYERKVFGKEQTHFPYTLSNYIGKDYSKLASTPHGNTILELLAETTVLNENLGSDNITDFLTVSFSSPDYIGHSFGPESWEQLDDYIKLDSTLGRFFSFLDKQVGAGNYLVFLTADHAVSNSPGFSVMHRLPGGAFNESAFGSQLKQMLAAQFNADRIIKGSPEDQLLLDYELIDSLKLDKKAVEDAIIKFAEQTPGVARAFNIREVSNTTLTPVQKQMYSNNYFPMRCGDIQIVLAPGYVGGDGIGTSHGLWNPYDAHIPLLWYGWNIKAGKTNRETYMTDIAATVAALLHIQMPSGCVGKVITEVFKQ